MGGEHGQDNDTGEEIRTYPGSDGRQGIQADQCRQQTYQEDINHGPGTHHFGYPVQQGPITEPPRPAPVHGNKQEAQQYQFNNGNDDAGNKDDHRQAPHTLLYEVQDTAHDGTGRPLAEADHRHHWIDIGRYQQDGGGGQ